MRTWVGTCIDSCAALFLLQKQALWLCPSLYCPNQLLSWGFMREWGYLSSPSIDGIYLLTSLPLIYIACLKWGVKERQQIQWSLNHSPYMNVIDWKYYYYYTIYLSNEWVTRGEKYLIGSFICHCDANKMGGAALPSKCCWNENVWKIPLKHNNKTKEKPRIIKCVIY